MMLNPMEKIMNEEDTVIAKACLEASENGTLSFPEIAAKLGVAGFEGYIVDYRQNTSTYFLSDGTHAVLKMQIPLGRVAAAFNAPGIEACVREAQANAPGYTYKGFCEKVKAFGCAGYFVSFLGRRVVYFGRTAETHVELFP